ncbi:MAG: superoxide dismutase, Fe-Mn family [Parcubacteria group bacterium Gr01-1014_30]|nr:MAG: superoxide dismutase, Fe-Mn family [Parcubacteria group bacterium Gr01-1014_30]
MHSLPKLPYPYDALEPFIDAKTMEIHYSKHHQTYVDKLNAALGKYPELFEKPLEYLLKNTSQVPEDIRQAVINHGGGHHNHSLFWTIMAPNAGGIPSGALSEEINQIWSSFEKFKEEFTNAALGIFGSGWAWLGIYQRKLKICTTKNQDSLLMEGKIPVLGLDMWEHAMYLLYQNRKNEYVSAWWNTVSWPEVERRYKEVK